KRDEILLVGRVCGLPQTSLDWPGLRAHCCPILPSSRKSPQPALGSSPPSKSPPACQRAEDDDDRSWQSRHLRMVDDAVDESPGQARHGNHVPLRATFAVRPGPCLITCKLVLRVGPTRVTSGRKWASDLRPNWLVRRLRFAERSGD